MFSGNRPEMNNSSQIGARLENILDAASESFNSIGDLSDLNTDHKSNIVESINEIADIIETPEMVVSFTKTNEELKTVYNLCVAHPQLCREVVFYNAANVTYYTTNGWSIGNNVVSFHVIMEGDNGLYAATVKLSSNGTLSI